MMILLKEQDGIHVGSEWKGSGGIAFVQMPGSMVFKHRTAAALSVTSAGVTTYTLPADAIGVAFQLHTSSVCWFGDSHVNPATNRGHFMMPRTTLLYRPATPGMTISFICAAAETATLGVIEYLAQ
jgi:hypothetical protein